MISSKTANSQTKKIKIVRDNRKSRNHGSRDFCDFRHLPWFCSFHQI